MTTLSQDPQPVRGARAVVGLAGFLALSLAVSGLGGLATASSVGTWYASLEKPTFNPPNWVFGPVWTTLYILVAVAGWRVWRRGGFAVNASALALFGVQMALNLAWSVLFFGLRRPDLALIDVAALFVAIVMTGRAFWRRDRVAGLLFVPYAAWVAFASVLNFVAWRLN